MSDPTSKPARKVSLGKGDDAAADTPAPARPNTVLLAIGALILSGVGAVAAGASLYGVRGWIRYRLENPSPKPKKPLTAKQIDDQVASFPTQQLVSGIVVLLAVSLIAWSVWRGRYWARWAVIGLWVLCSLTNTPASFNSVFAIGESLPIGFKVPLALSGLALLVAVVMVMLPASGRYFARSKPVPAAGAPARRGLFAPRTPPPPRARAATTRPEAAVAANDPATPPRARTKKRADTQSVAKGAELARTRAKAAGKSRRTES